MPTATAPNNSLMNRLLNDMNSPMRRTHNDTAAELERTAFHIVPPKNWLHAIFLYLFIEDIVRLRRVCSLIRVTVDNIPTPVLDVQVLLDVDALALPLGGLSQGTSAPSSGFTTELLLKERRREHGVVRSRVRCTRCVSGLQLPFLVTDSTKRQSLSPLNQWNLH